MDNCIFCKIIRGEVPAAKIWEDENFLAFETVMAINPGHTLIIPKKHIDYLFDLDDQTLAQLMVASKPIAKAIAKAFRPKTGRVGMMIAGMGVPHAHVHLVPMNAERDLDFSKAKEISMEVRQANAERIKVTLNPE